MNHSVIRSASIYSAKLPAIAMPDYDSDDDADDYAHHWRQCNAANLILLSKAITDLCTMMDYQAPAEEKAA